jgi:hypothetical protein
MRRDHSNVAVFCFANPEDAEAFAKRFVGRSCLRPSDNHENNRGDPEGCLLIATESTDSRRAAFQGGPESDGNDVIIDRELPKNDIRSLIN